MDMQGGSVQQNQQNPQSNVGGGLQPNSPNLQPLPATDTSAPTFTQQQIPVSNRRLEVIVENRSPGGLAPAGTENEEGTNWILPIGLFTLVLLFVLVIMVRRTRSQIAGQGSPVQSPVQGAGFPQATAVAAPQSELTEPADLSHTESTSPEDEVSGELHQTAEVKKSSKAANKAKKAKKRKRQKR
jgi:hypothetical protein